MKLQFLNNNQKLKTVKITIEHYWSDHHFRAKHISC